MNNKDICKSIRIKMPWLPTPGLCWGYANLMFGCQFSFKFEPEDIRMPKCYVYGNSPRTRHHTNTPSQLRQTWKFQYSMCHTIFILKCQKWRQPQQCVECSFVSWRYKICGKVLYSFDGQNIVDCGYSFGDDQKVPRTLSAIQHPQEMMEERQIQRS